MWNVRKPLIAGIVFLCVQSVGLAQEEYTVESSNASRYPKGKILGIKTDIRLLSNENIAIRATDGKEETLPGSYSGKYLVAQIEKKDEKDKKEEKTKRKTLREMLRKIRKEFSKITGIRGYTDCWKPEILWKMCVLQDDDFCFENKEKLVLLRPAGDKLTLRISKWKSREQIKLLWREPEIEWEKSYKKAPFEDGATYRVKLGDNIPRKISLHQLPDNWDELEVIDKGRWVMEKGCVRQAGILLFELEQGVN
ncbi:MAG: hypothetical protein GY862_29860 [Gammaproteobacteria bacterium]|nr:hypothetical protein [Gammaproteobacteria bacterium]